MCCPCGFVKSALSAVAMDATDETIPPLSLIYTSAVDFGSVGHSLECPELDFGFCLLL
jgi:hypothetical protein